MAFWEGVGDPCDRDGVVLMIVVVVLVVLVLLLLLLLLLLVLLVLLLLCGRWECLVAWK